MLLDQTDWGFASRHLPATVASILTDVPAIPHLVQRHLVKCLQAFPCLPKAVIPFDLFKDFWPLD